MTITHEGNTYNISEEIVFALNLTKNRRRGSSLHVWRKRMPVSEFPTFTKTGQVKDLLPVMLVEKVTWQPWPGTFQSKTNRYPLEYLSTLLCASEVPGNSTLLLQFKFSVAASKAEGIERCLEGMGYKEVFNV